MKRNEVRGLMRSPSGAIRLPRVGEGELHCEITVTVDSLHGHFLRPLGHGTSSEPRCEHEVFAGGRGGG